MKLKPYADALLQTEKDEAVALAPARAEEAKAQLSMKLAQLSIAIKRQDLAVAELGSRYPLDVNGIQAAADELTLLTFSESQLKEIQKQLFPA